jgi:hypothetical protein
LTAEKLATELRTAEQAETWWELTGANAALQLAQDELCAVWLVSEREQAQALALLDEINLVD